MKSIGICAVVFVLASSLPAFSHCDTMDGPVVADARKAIEQNNVNYALKWVSAENEDEVRNAFDLAMRVRSLNDDAKNLADMHFFETLVRIHRNDEGIGYTGIMPPGTPVDPRIKAADESVALGNLTPIEKLVPAEKMPELEKRFARVMQLNDFDVNDVSAGRAFVEAYVQFFHFAEGEHEGSHVHHAQSHHTQHVAWILAIIFFATTVVLIVLYLSRSARNKIAVNRL